MTIQEQMWGKIAGINYIGYHLDKWWILVYLHDTKVISQGIIRGFSKYL